MISALRATLVVSALALVLLVANGCGPRHNVTPALSSYAHHHQQDVNRYRRTIDHNTRQAWDDLANIFLLDRPVRLVKYPVP